MFSGSVIGHRSSAIGGRRADVGQAVRYTGLVSLILVRGTSWAVVPSSFGPVVRFRPDSSLDLIHAASHVAAVRTPERPKTPARGGWRGGTLGDPRASSAANGQLGVDAVVKIASEAIKKAVASPR